MATKFITSHPPSAGLLLREVTRVYVRAQRKQASCDNSANTVRCHVLTELLRQDGLSQQQLVDRLSIDKSWISRAVDGLVQEGTVLKQAHLSDRRSVQLVLTPLGRDRATSLDTRLNTHAQGLLDHLPAETQAHIAQALQHVLDALQAPACAKAPSTANPTQHTFHAVRTNSWPAVAALLQQVGLPPDGAQAHLRHFVLSRVRGKLACAGGLEVYGDTALLRSVVVAPGLQRQGLGQALVAHLLHKACGLGVRQLYLRTTSASEYFAKLGFAPVPLADVPPALQSSSQFQGACPSSANIMVLQLLAPKASARAKLTSRRKSPSP